MHKNHTTMTLANIFEDIKYFKFANFQIILKIANLNKFVKTFVN